jgi:hypothetical protein
MRVRFDYDAAASTFKMLLGECVAVTCYPMAIVVGVTRHPDAFMMMLETLLIASNIAVTIWVVFLLIDVVCSVGVLLLCALARIVTGCANGAKHILSLLRID